MSVTSSPKKSAIHRLPQRLSGCGAPDSELASAIVIITEDVVMIGVKDQRGRALSRSALLYQTTRRFRPVTSEP